MIYYYFVTRLREVLTDEFQWKKRAYPMIILVLFFALIQHACWYQTLSFLLVLDQNPTPMPGWTSLSKFFWVWPVDAEYRNSNLEAPGQCYGYQNYPGWNSMIITLNH